jgi:protein-tyrosine phosphatase
MNAYFRTQWGRYFGLNISPVDQLLFLGGQFRPSQWAGLHALGVRAVLNLQAERVDAFEGGRPERALHVPVRDFTAPSLAQLDEGVAFIVAARAAQLPVFVHCHSGVGRAPLMAAAYLMASEGHSHAEALRRLAAARPIIGPNWMQLARLREYEQRLGAASRGQGGESAVV